MHKKVTIFICLIVLYSCSNKEVSFDSLVERAGIYYEVNNEKPFTGSIYKKLENNQFLLTGEFDKGFKSGEWIEYYENGQKKLVQNYSNQGKLNGIEETYNESGQLLSKGNFKNNQKNGLWENYYANGSMRFKGNYTNNDYDGLVERFYENGAPSFKGIYLDGKYNGLIEEWYTNGNKKSEINYSNGLLDGKFKEFSNQGFLKKEFSYKNDKKSGLCVVYYSKDKKYTSTNYKNGIKDGVYEEWYDNNQKFKEIDFDNGKIKSQKFWNNDGTVKPIVSEGIIGTWRFDYDPYKGRKSYALYTFKKGGSFIKYYTNYAGAEWTDYGSYWTNGDQVSMQWTTGAGLSKRTNNPTWEIVYLTKNKLKTRKGETWNRK